MNTQIGKVNNVHCIASRFYSYNIFVIFGSYCNSVKVNACRKNSAVVVVGVVSANLRSAGCREKSYVPVSRENLVKIVGKRAISLILRLNVSLTDINSLKSIVKLSILNFFSQLCSCTHLPFILSVLFVFFYFCRFRLC